MNPLEQIIIALRPILPTVAQVPFLDKVPNSVRLIDPTKPLGATLDAPPPAGWFDPNGVSIASILNHYVNFGWEYVYHCHILAHEEMDMMHGMAFAVPPKAPSLVSVVVGSGRAVLLTWTANSPNVTGYTVQRAKDPGFTTSLVSWNLGNVTTYADTTYQRNQEPYYYRVFASNTVGDTNTPGFTSITVKSGFSATARIPSIPPVVTSVVPSSGMQGRTLTGVLINGTNLTGATAVTFSGTGVTASNLVVNPAGTQITATVNIALGAATGPRNVTVTTPAGTSAALVGGFNVVTALPLPVVTSILPIQGTQGQTLTGVLINGTNLTGATAVTFSGIGVTASNLVVTDTQITATLTISGTAALGPRDITVTTPAGTSAALVGGFTVLASPSGPTVTSIDPISGVQGQTLTGVLINGTNLTGATAVNFSGTGITASIVTVNNTGTQITATFTIAPAAPLGTQIVTVTTPAGTSGPLPLVGFTVFAPQPLPTVTSLFPNSGMQGQTLSGVLINGTNLAGVTAVRFSGTLVTAGNLVVNPAGTQITATVNIALGAAIGPRDVTVTTPTGTSAALVGGFTVIVPPPPTVTSILPAEGNQGQTLTGVLVNGTNLTGATSVNFSGTGVTASNLVVNPAGTQITATVAISGTAAAGPRNVTVTNLGGTSAPITFTVKTFPTLSSVVPSIGRRSRTLTGVLINGNSLTGATAVTFSGTGVTASNLVVNPAGTQITATVTITGTAALGPRDVTVTTGLGTSAPLVGGFTIIPNVPSDPSNVAATAVPFNIIFARVTLTWTDNADNETGFTVQRATDAAFTANLTTSNVGVRIGIGLPVTFTTGNLPRNASFYFRVRAVNAAGTSAWVTATPFPIITP